MKTPSRLQPLLDEGLIDSVQRQLMSGKEAAVYVVTRGAAVRRDGLTLQVVVERQTRLTVPIHQLESVAAFGGVHVTPPAMGLCAEAGVAVNFLTEAGRLYRDGGPSWIAVSPSPRPLPR